ncbi:MAG: tetratricopeptide repeat protein [Muribaculaceae bacterium]|nr:tetratricopeptide repeat protein [Muribaculaceae bacterium]
MKLSTILTAAVAGLMMLCTASASANPGLIEQADSAYINDDFAVARDLYEQAIDSLGTSATLYYNLGNTYYRLGNNGMAIVCYERALRLDPTNQDVKTNLEFVNSRITDKVGNSGSFLSNTFDRIVCLAHSNTWSNIGLTSFFLLLGSIALYIFSNNVKLRKIGFFGGILLAILTAAAIILALDGATKAVTHNTAIVTDPSTILSTSPRTPKDRSEEAFLLHEGTKVTILDSVTSAIDSTRTKWYEVSVDNTHRAWISSKAIERI